MIAGLVAQPTDAVAVSLDPFFRRLDAQAVLATGVVVHRFSGVIRRIPQIRPGLHDRHVPLAVLSLPVFRSKTIYIQRRGI